MPNAVDHLRVDPHALGPVGPGPAAPGRVFPGDLELLGERQAERRARLVEMVRGRVERLLQPGETVLHLLPVLERPPLARRLALASASERYRHAALLVTDRRVVELLQAPGGRALGTRVQSFPLSQAAEVRLCGRVLTLVPRAGRTYRWRVPVAGDRALLAELLPRLDAALPLAVSPVVRSAPLWHCPRCAAVLPPRRSACRACGTGFRSPRLAVALALAFPGAGLAYAGHRVLAALALAAELMVFAVVAMGLLTAPPELRVPASALGLAVLVVMKLAAAGVAHWLGERSIPEPPGSGRRWRRAAPVAAAVSVAAVALPLALAGVLAAVVDHDLDFSSAPGWEGGFDRSAWRWDRGDETKRSEWTSADGRVVVVWAYALDHDGLAGFRATMEQQWTASGREPITPVVVAGLEGFRCLVPFEAGDGALHTEVRFVVFDPEGRDAHVLSTVCWPRETGLVEAELRALLGLARWVPTGG